jgi:hypothetical protein
MDFKVYTDGGSKVDSYSGSARYEITSTALLTIRDERRHIVYGPNGWTRLEFEEEAPPGVQQRKHF